MKNGLSMLPAEDESQDDEQSSKRLGSGEQASRALQRSASISRLEVAYQLPELANPSDERLVAAILAGNSRAAGTLYEELRPSIDGALRRVLHGRRTDFEDLVQITFERVIRTIIEGRFEGRSRLSTWAGAIAAHVAMDSLRKRTREKRVFSEADAADPEPLATTLVPERQLEARSEVRRLQGVLSRLKPELANVLLLHDVLGYSVPEIAELYGMKITAVQSRLSRARKEFLRRSSAKISGDV